MTATRTPAPPRSKHHRLDGESLMALQLAGVGLEGFVREFRFHPVRKWRFDFAWPEKKLAIEIEGGAFVGGRHTTGAGFRADLEKYNAAALLGWKVLRFLPEWVGDGAALRMVQEVIGVGI